MELHLHDNDGSGDAHLPVGQGNIDFPGLFQLLRQKQRRPLLTLEPHSQEHLTESLGGLLQVMGADL
jgi:sugar phosphate isomerase/epimerase